MKEQTLPSSNRIHIAICGAVNSGKSSLLNAITEQSISIVSNIEGTTTDAVRKNIELPSVGPVHFIDTPGYNDQTALGHERTTVMRKAIESADIIILICNQCVGHAQSLIIPPIDYDYITSEVKSYKNSKQTIIPILSQSDRYQYTEQQIQQIKKIVGRTPHILNSNDRNCINQLIESIKQEVNRTKNQTLSIVGNLAQAGDVVVLVMPQDKSAPQGRLILPQSQTIRELIDKQCITLSCTLDNFVVTLQSLKCDPDLIITDSSVFHDVIKLRPQSTPLTSFSILFAALKGDLTTMIDGAKIIDHLTINDRILIAEACTHAPEEEDIGRVKIPNILRQRIGQELQIDLVAGREFPDDLSPYKLIIHCGACMFNRQLVMERIRQAKKNKSYITNYGLAIAQLKGILPQVVLPTNENTGDNL